MAIRSLQGVLAQYSARHVNLRPSSVQQLLYSVRALERFCGQVDVRRIDEELLCAWLRRRIESGCATETVRRDRRNVLTLIRWARTQGWVTRVPEVPTLKAERRSPTAWTLDELARLILQAEALSGNMRGLDIPRRWWWKGLLLTLYDTGARLTAALSIRVSDLFLDRRLVRLRAACSKTRQDQICTLSDQTVDVLREGLTDRPLVFPYPWSKRKLWRDLAQLQHDAGLPTGREFAFHRFRRTHATQAVIAAGWAAAQRSLGHSCEQMTRVYVDQSQVMATVRINLPRPQIS